MRERGLDPDKEYIGPREEPPKPETPAEQKPPCPPPNPANSGGGITSRNAPNFKFHYTSASESAFAKGLRGETHVTDTPNYTAQEARDKLGLTSTPDKVIPIQDNGNFVPSRPPVVQANPSRGINGGGADFYNPSAVSPNQIGPALPI